ncbi:TonB-dependent receptor plug domain-containing protein [Tenacibaculum geojense]|uniref:TonB-dependent receptor plug domain-containing protein n=1 Tax=Tenacibaculum geojense TaxID=915352 RepID=A0ABW3JS82_9FLAO
MTRFLLTALLSLSTFILSAQSVITGTVYDEYLEPFPGATVRFNNGTTTSDFNGEFKLEIKKFPLLIQVSSVGYKTETIEITSAEDEVNVILKEALALDEIVLSASRTPERVLESPVTIERIGAKNIKRTASPNFYESLKNLKGINILDNNYNTKIVTSNRGFANTLNNRFVQLVDGAESSIPTFEYSFGNLFGLNELDVKNVEILPGAASALYGANAFNGILLMTSKNPFEDTGISVYTKSGVTVQNEGNRATYGYYDVGVRMAEKFSESFAAKVNLVYNKGEDWHATDKRNTTGQGGEIIDGFSHADNPGYDGVNVYGDEIGFNFRDIIRNLENRGVTFPDGSPIPANTYQSIDEDVNVSRVGYEEKDLNNYTTKYVTFDGALHFRPWGTDNAEIILGSKLHVSDNIIHASNRYDQRGGFMQQYKFEIKDDNYFVRAYYTDNDSGQTTDSRLAGIFVENQWKNHEDYFGQYGIAYLSAVNQGQSEQNAHAFARQVAETGRYLVGSPQYKAALENAKNTSINNGGARLRDNTGYYHVDANLNLAGIVEFADIQFGGSFRSFALDSQGEIYTDDNDVIRHRAYGLYSQVQKRFDDDRLKITGTVRYDKAKNFEGKFSPRATVSYAAGESKNHNFRLAFQTAFRNPTSQDQYLGLQLGDRVFLGTVEENLNREVSVQQLRSNPNQTVTLTGENAFYNSYTASSVEAFQNEFRSSGTINPALLEVAQVDFIKPETVQSFELGYRAAVTIGSNIFEFDMVGFYNRHQNFITTKQVFTPFYGDVNDTNSNDAVAAVAQQDILRYILRTNTDAEIDAYGFSAGFGTKILGGFDLGASYAFSDYSVDSDDLDFKPSFNTPKHQIKASLGHEKLFKNFGFAVDGRWQDEFLYQSRFIDALVEERVVLDAQLNLTIPSIKSFIKVGGTNLLGKDYVSVPGTGTIGTQYYISWTINN